MMVKRLLSIIAITLTAITCWAGNVIIIEQKDGTNTRFVFNSEAEITYNGGNLVITSSEEQAIFELSTLQKATFQTENTVIENEQEEQATFIFSNNTITVENARANALLQIFSVDGRRAGVWHTDGQGHLMVDMNGFKDNIYIIALDELTYKIAKR